ncbi:MAG TPA: hypothetical protein PLP34_02470, partial [Chitinophagaceae bacterium]|nr:hypothetical protein [Chitinophagaceae bacterium]
MPVKAYTVLFLFTLFLSCKKETLQIVATPVSVPTTLTLNKIIFTDAQHGFIAGGDRYSAVVVLSCSGLSTPWKIVQLPETTEKREAYDIESNPQGHIAICGYGGTFYYSTDTGNTFQYYQHSSWSSLRAMAYCTQHQLAIVEGHSFSKGFLSWFEPTSKQLSNKQQEWNFECSDICFPDA